MTHTLYEHWKKTPLCGSPDLSVVIPAYNEAQRIMPTIRAITAYVCRTGMSWELIIADDGSSDGTADLCESLGMANMRVLRAPKNGGKGSAVRHGVLAARGYYVLFCDADNSTPIEELAKLMDALERGNYDIAVGSRAIAGAEEINRSPLRRLLSIGLRTIVRYGLRIGVCDTQCGFKLFTSAAAQRLHMAQTLKGFSFDLEILYLAARLGYEVAEVPVVWVDAPGSKVDPLKESRRFMGDMLAIQLNALRGLYPKV
jgi:dolichyl-phosphate beta-glucosyltransferase